MRHLSGGCAAVLVYENGQRTSVLTHEHDGGEAYMGPLLRKAVQYAKVQYKSGDITQVLLSEEEMALVAAVKAVEYLRTRCVRHVYYVSAEWDAERAKKRYGVRVLHLGPSEPLEPVHLPEFAQDLAGLSARLQAVV